MMSNTDSSGGRRGVEETLVKMGQIIAYVLVFAPILILSFISSIQLKYHEPPIGVLYIALLIVFCITALIECIMKVLRKPTFKPISKYLVVPVFVLLLTTKAVIVGMYKGRFPVDTFLIVGILVVLYILFRKYSHRL